jgi:hypothetical protein
MAKFLLLYRSSVTAAEQMASGTPEQAEEGMKLWMEWAGKAGGALLDLGSPVSGVGSVGGSASSGTPVGGFSIMEADSLDALKSLLDGHPHLQSPGDATIEILEFLPIPGM